ncbi:MAG: hypothetical protein ABJN36_11610 [Cyclobacteriaceae bacterium]
MAQFIELLSRDFQNFLEQHDFKIETAHEGQLHVIYNPDFNVKVYDCMGHGFGVNTNLCSSFDTSIYEGDEMAMYWVFKYFDLQEQSNFSARTKEAYLKNLQLLYSDLQLVIIRLLDFGSDFWNEPAMRINLLAKEHFKN